jgi:hypothetical protein
MDHGTLLAGDALVTTLMNLSLAQFATLDGPAYQHAGFVILNRSQLAG